MKKIYWPGPGMQRSLALQNRKQDTQVKPIKADMFSSPDNSVIRDPLNADIRDLDVSSALLRMWYQGLEAKGY